MKKKTDNQLKDAFLLEEGIAEESEKATPKPAKADPQVTMWKAFEQNLEKSVGAKGQGNAVWIPDDVMKRLKIVAAEASRNLPIRAMVTAIVTTFLDEYEKKMKKL